ncbi:S-methyl-5'-thioinosine phosphorylase [Inmirania thermothiophila]|uniref:Probable S-methyl-5'-thioinosine phosphorylase n=1 Tax=Inmirania thermothiophila TaxID=1750597 RepID=A0A3N1Y3X6_9GAMM|nr:S-methyl-5'-thioinosine phosphorylase [Inmirania thermothiophila]ROR32312.1 methylthioadenosine phosphorylase [Inmirania thermothiophila]
MAALAIIGGTGLTRLAGLELTERRVVHTRWGSPSSALLLGRLHGREVIFLARHGERHTIPPHRVNYRANIQALKDAGVERVLAVAAVGGIRGDLAPGRLAIPDQIIDYTHGRAQTFFEDDLEEVVHVDFTEPYCEALRRRLIEAAEAAGVPFSPHGTYAATEGPRLETAAEIDRLERDGCHMVGMTGMPEAALAREAGLCYAACAVVANWAAGRGEGPIGMDEIRRNLETGMGHVGRLLEALMPRL